MKACWSHDSNERPSFDEISSVLKKLQRFNAVETAKINAKHSMNNLLMNSGSISAQMNQTTNGNKTPRQSLASTPEQHSSLLVTPKAGNTMVSNPFGDIITDDQ